MSTVENQYLSVLQQLVTQYDRHDPQHVNNINRTATRATKQWVNQIRHNFDEGFPLLTTKKVWWRGIVSELVGFLAGITNHHDFEAIGGSVWGEWALPEDYLSYAMTDPQDRLVRLANVLGVGLYEANLAVVKSIETYGMEIGTRKIYEDNGIDYEVVTARYRKGDLGPIYGAIWRDFGGVDQIMDLLVQLRTNPASRRHVVSAWQPNVLPDENETHANNVRDGRQALPPCHLMFQYDVQLRGDGTPILNSMFLMRSADVFLGVPFNIASYALLSVLIARELNFELGESVAVLNNNHLYHDAVDVVREQLTRTPNRLPTLDIPAEVNLMKILACKGARTPEQLDVLREQVDLLVNALTDYKPAGKLTAPVAI